MKIFTQIISTIPILAWIIFRFMRPRMIYKDLKAGVFSDKQNALWLIIIEGLIYLVPAYFLSPFNKQQPIALTLLWGTFILLSIWYLFYGFCFIRYQRVQKT